MCSRFRTKSEAREGNEDAPRSLLDFVINSRRYLTERDVRPLAQQLARTLSLMHAHGVVHRNLKLDNVFIRVDPAVSGGRRAILTDFTFATVVTASSSSSSSVDPATPAPELLLLGTCQSAAADSCASADASVLALAPYAGPPVDVWGLGVVLYTLVCRRAPFDAPTLDLIRETSLRSPVGLPFPMRISRDCRDLLRRMLRADPTARASLYEVLNHPWMKSAFRRPCNVLLVGADADVPMHAALRWPDKVDRKTFCRIAALESRNGDDAWRNLAAALELVSHLC